MATIETKYNIGQEVWVISCENLGPDIKKRTVSGITVETIDLRSYENLRNEPIVTYGGFCYRVKYGKRVISYREWIDPDNAKMACEIEKKETIKDVCELLESELKRWSKGNDSCEAKYRIEMLKELIEKLNE